MTRDFPTAIGMYPEGFRVEFEDGAVYEYRKSKALWEQVVPPNSPPNLGCANDDTPCEYCIGERVGGFLEQNRIIQDLEEMRSSGIVHIPIDQVIALVKQNKHGDTPDGRAVHP